MTDQVLAELLAFIAVVFTPIALKVCGALLVAYVLIITVQAIRRALRF